MKSILFNLLLFCFSTDCFCQRDETIDKVNKLIGPFYIANSDSLWEKQFGYYKEIDLDGDYINEIVVSAIDTANEENKIFVFKVEKDKLKIIDTSSTYAVDGKGPEVVIVNDTLDIIHDFHHGGYDFAYKFNKVIQKFELVTVSLYHTEPYYPDADHLVHFDQEFDVITGTLYLYSDIVNYKNSKTKSKTKKIVEHITPDKSLSAFKDPVEGDFNDKMFINEGTVYDEMTTYK